jgi:hypothetical protein
MAGRDTRPADFAPGISQRTALAPECFAFEKIELFQVRLV